MRCPLGAGGVGLLAVGLATPLPAAACTCGDTSGTVLIQANPRPTRLPTNGVFRLWRISGEKEEHVVVDAQGAEVPTVPRHFPDVAGGTWTELAPLEPLTLGERYYLRAHDRTLGGAEHLVDREQDDDPPVLSDADFDRTQRHKDTSCGLWRYAYLNLDYRADEGEAVGVRILDLGSGLYWHGPMTWTTMCGGHPEEHWSGRKEVTMYDAAGNESEPIRTGVTRGCSSGGAPRPSSPWALLLLIGTALRRPVR